MILVRHHRRFDTVTVPGTEERRPSDGISSSSSRYRPSRATPFDGCQDGYDVPGRGGCTLDGRGWGPPAVVVRRYALTLLTAMPPSLPHQQERKKIRRARSDRRAQRRSRYDGKARRKRVLADSARAGGLGRGGPGSSNNIQRMWMPRVM